MFTKLPFEVVEVRVWELTESLLNKSFEEQLLILDEIDIYLEACGWTNTEFHDEALKRINEAWYDKRLN